MECTKLSSKALFKDSEARNTSFPWEMAKEYTERSSVVLSVRFENVFTRARSKEAKNVFSLCATARTKRKEVSQQGAAILGHNFRRGYTAVGGLPGSAFSLLCFSILLNARAYAE